MVVIPKKATFGVPFAVSLALLVNLIEGMIMHTVDVSVWLQKPCRGSGYPRSQGRRALRYCQTRLEDQINGHVIVQSVCA